MFGARIQRADNERAPSRQRRERTFQFVRAPIRQLSVPVSSPAIHAPRTNNCATVSGPRRNAVKHNGRLCVLTKGTDQRAVPTTAGGGDNEVNPGDRANTTPASLTLAMLGFRLVQATVAFDGGRGDPSPSTKNTVRFSCWSTCNVTAVASTTIPASRLAVPSTSVQAIRCETITYSEHTCTFVTLDADRGSLREPTILECTPLIGRICCRGS